MSHFSNNETKALLKRLSNLFRWCTYPVWTKLLSGFPGFLLLHTSAWRGFPVQIRASALGSLPALSDMLSIAAFLPSFLPLCVCVFETADDSSSGSEKG